MEINTSYVEKCIETLDRAYQLLQDSSIDIDKDIYRSACIKEFEIILEQTGKLLKKRLGDYFSSSREADTLSFKDTFRTAVKFDVLDISLCERWLSHRNRRNITAHDYGEQLADDTIRFIPDFINDARSTIAVIKDVK